jgi:hypothetical protein
VLSVSRNAGFAQLSRDAAQARNALRRSDNTYFDRAANDPGLQHYAQHFAWGDAADLLEKEASRIDKSSSESDHLLLLADLYRARGDGEREFSALRRWWLKSRTGAAGFDSRNERLDRYLDLLLARNKPAELAEVTGTPGGYAGQLINGLLARQRTDLALATVDALTKSYSVAWRDSKKLLIASRLGLPLDKVGAFTSPADLMGDMPIGRRLDAPADPTRTLIGEDWFAYLPHFADWLATQKEDRVSSIILGVAEGAPRDPERQRLIGQWFARHERYDAAQRHFDLALQLKTNDPHTYAVIGEMLLKKGDRTGALAAWRRIIPDKASALEYDIWFTTLNANGLLEDAIPIMNAWLNTALDSDADWNVRGLVSTYADALAKAGREAVLVDLLVERARALEDPIELLSSFQADLPIAAPQRARLMQEIISAAERRGGEATEGEDGYYSYPVLKNWLDTGIEFAVEAKLWDYALAWIDRYEAAGYLKEYGYLFSDEQAWRRMRGKVLLARGEKEAGIRELEQSLAKAEYWSADAHQAVYEIMMGGGAAREARDLMIAFYRTALTRGFEYQPYYLGLAEMLLERARRDNDAAAGADAVSALSRMVNAMNDNTLGMRQAADLLERFDRHADARRFRVSLRALEPGDAMNTLRLAIGAARAGDEAGALALFRELHTGQGIAREVRLEAVQPYIELFSGNPEAARAEADRYATAAANSEIDLILQADLLEKAGDPAAARALLETGVKNLFEPSIIFMKQARGAVAAGNREAAVTLYYSALRNESRPKAKRELFRLLAEMKRNRELLLLLDQLDMDGLNYADEDRLAAVLGVQGADLLPFQVSLVEAAIAEGEYYLALDYETTRVALAQRLGQTVTDRSDEINALQERASAPRTPVYIDESIAN